MHQLLRLGLGARDVTLLPHELPFFPIDSISNLPLEQKEVS